MMGIDFKQIPNLEQVYVVALVPLLFVALALLGLIVALWRVRLLQKQIDALTADLKAIVDKHRDQLA